VNAYVRVAKGQKSGGFNASVQTGFLNPFAPEQLLQYEAGVKAELLDNRVTIDADVYTGDYKNLQRQVIRVIRGAPSVFVSNASKAKVSGGELEVSIAPVENLLISGGLGYTDAKYDLWEFVDPVTGSRQNLSANKFANTPKYTYSLSAQYTVPMGSDALEFALTLNGDSSYFLSPENQSDFVQKGYALLNGRVSYVLGQHWEFQIFADNITNKYYQTFGSVYGLPGGDLLVPVSGTPRMEGASITYRF
jgi:iron complex outermembrane receptor protein